MRADWGVIVAYSVVFGMAVGCAPDRNLEQFQAGKRREQLDRIEAISGVYRGEVALGSGAGVTGLEVMLEGSTEAMAGIQVATIRGALRLGGVQRVQIGFSQGAYDPESRDLALRIPLELTSGNRDTLLLRGRIEGDALSGMLGFEVHDSDWQRVTLVKGATLPEGLIEVQSADWDRDDSGGVRGEARLEGVARPSGEPMRTFMTVSEVEVTNQHLFFNALSNTRLVQVMLSFGGPEISYSLAGEYDVRSRVLRAFAVLPSPAGVTDLRCGPRGDQWRCFYRTSLGGFSIEFGRSPF